MQFLKNNGLDTIESCRDKEDVNDWNVQVKDYNLGLLNGLQIKAYEPRICQ